MTGRRGATSLYDFGLATYDAEDTDADQPSGGVDIPGHLPSGVAACACSPKPSDDWTTVRIMPMKVTISGELSDDLYSKLEQSILKQAGLR